MAIEPAPAADLAELPAQRGEQPNEIGEIVAGAAEALPVDPADLIVLAIGIVVAGLRIGDLVAGQDQRRALREQQAGELVSPQLPAQCRDGRIIGRALMTAIVAVVVVGAVAIVLAIGLV